MPNKYPQKKGWNIPKQKYKLTNWPEYNQSLKRQGSIDVWLSEEAISMWHVADRVYDVLELTAGLTDYFSFYNTQRPHQSLGYSTPDDVYKSGVGGGACIVDKFNRSIDVKSGQHRVAA